MSYIRQRSYNTLLKWSRLLSCRSESISRGEEVMRILLVTYWGLTNMGGIWTYMRQLADKLSEQGHSVTLMGSHVENNTLYLLGQNASFDKKPSIPCCSRTSILLYSRICIWSMAYSALSWGVMYLRVERRFWGWRITMSFMPRTPLPPMRCGGLCAVRFRSSPVCTGHCPGRLIMNTKGLCLDLPARNMSSGRSGGISGGWRRSRPGRPT